MNKILLIPFLMINLTFAEYIAKIPLEQSIGGMLPNGSINIGNTPVFGGNTEICYGSIKTTRIDYQTSNIMTYSILFEEFDENSSYIFEQEFPSVENGSYAPLITSTHRYSIGEILEQYENTYNFTHYIPEGENSTVLNIIYEICKEEVIGGSFGPKSCCIQGIGN